MANNRIKANFQGGSLGAALTAAGTTITFAAAPGFATLANGDFIATSLEPNGGSALAEIVYLTAYTAGATTGTIGRGKEGTTGVAHSNGVSWTHAPTALDFPPFSDTLLGSATSGITISNIPAGFATIEVDVYARSDTASTSTSLLMQFNGDTGANYTWLWAYPGNGSGSNNTTGATSASCGNVPAASDTAKAFAANRIVIPNYTDSTHDKAFTTLGISLLAAGYSPATNLGGSVGGGIWSPSSSAAITSITLFPGAGNFAAGTRVVTRLT